MKRFALLAAAAALCACQTFEADRGGGGLELTQEATGVDLVVTESRTLGHLATIETSIADFIGTERKIPTKITDLIPKYLAEIPMVELGEAKHKDTSAVQYYPSDVIRDGVVDGTRLKDSGRWGYVFNDKQVIIFVDCTHRNSRGVPWYQARGVY